MFATNLRQTLDALDLSTRAAARAWNPEDPETARRTINRWLAGTTPSETARDSFAAAVGATATMLPLPTDEDVTADLLADLMAAVRRLERTQTEILERVA
jgi:hypothetical protein